jgi:hypothetical protein
MHPLLAHVLEDSCTDPDCEIHHAIIGFREEVVDEVQIAFWLAGAYASRDAFQETLQEMKDYLADRDFGPTDKQIYGAGS